LEINAIVRSGGFEFSNARVNAKDVALRRTFALAAREAPRPLADSGRKIDQFRDGQYMHAHLGSNAPGHLHCSECLRGAVGSSMFRTRCLVLFILGASFVAQRPQTKVSIASIESLIRSQEYDQALQMTRSALQETPNDFRLWTLEGIVLSIKGENQDALNAFEKALSLSPSYGAALRGEVRILYAAQDKRAIPLLERILKADPSDETAHEMLATFDAKEGNCQAAIDHFLLSVKAIGTHPDSLQAYGYCLVQTGQSEKAIPVFEQLAALLPQQTYPKYDLAVALVETKQDEAALKVLEPLLATDQSDPDLLSLASEAYEAVRNTPKAVSLLREAIVLNPANANYYVAFATLCLDHQSFQVGIDMINAGLQRVPDDPSLFISRGLLYAQIARYDQAEADFNTAERLDSAQTLSLYAKDLAELEKDHSVHSDKAVSAVRSQSKAHPDSALLHCLLARLLVNEGPAIDSEASKEAMRSALLAVKLKPDLVEARDILTGMYIRSGQYSLAAEQCRLTLQYDPSDRSAVYHLIMALRHSGQSEHRDEIKALLKRLSDLQQAALHNETDRKRFRLVEQQPPSSPGTTGPKPEN
jgi:tetratricopeptide (TPR) repeat protein